MADRDGDTQAPDYHTRPVLAARVDAGIRAWVYAEAPRRGRKVGDFLDDVLAAERARSGDGPAAGVIVMLRTLDEDGYQQVRDAMRAWEEADYTGEVSGGVQR